VDGSERLTISQGDGPDPVLRVAGDLDAYTAPALEELLVGRETGGDVRVDLSGVTFIDSTGIRAIVRADNDLRGRDRTLVVMAPSPSVMRLLELTSLDERIRIEPVQP
jgi:anti-sigma B factor antagonist